MAILSLVAFPGNIGFVHIMMTTSGNISHNAQFVSWNKHTKFVNDKLLVYLSLSAHAIRYFDTRPIMYP
jgi:hypothetical protein